MFVGTIWQSIGECRGDIHGASSSGFFAVSIATGTSERNCDGGCYGDDLVVTIAFAVGISGTKAAGRGTDKQS